MSKAGCGATIDRWNGTRGDGYNNYFVRLPGPVMQSCPSAPGHFCLSAERRLSQGSLAYPEKAGW